MLLPIVYISHPNQIKGVSQNVEEYTFYPPPPPKNRDKFKNFRNVKTTLRASTLVALGLLLALAVLLPNAASEAQTSPASTPTPGPLPPPTTDYDADNDGLIDIRTLAQLNAVRHDLDGDGKQGSVSATDWATYTAAFPNPTSGMGCKPTDHDDDTTTAKQPTCDGYELMADLDFDTDGDGDVDASDTNSYANWAPIGTATKPFNSKFEGSLTNGVMPKISNLTISGELTEVGLFGATGSNAHIENVGLVDVNVNTTTSARNAKISALVGNNAGKIIACYSTGAITATAGAYPDAGGLVGYNGGTIAAAFSRAAVYMSSSSEVYVGGLVGYNGGTITATYSAGAVKGKGGSGVVGGLVGYNVGTINASYSIAPVTSVDVDPTNIRTSKPSVQGLSYNENGFSTVTVSYWDSIISGVPDDADDVMPEGKITSNLITPIGIYNDWEALTIDGANNVNPWNSTGGVPTDGLPLLTYGGHTTDVSGNQLFAYISSHNTGASPVVEGARYIASIPPSMGSTSGPWLWQSSADGITWGSTLVSNIVCGVQQDRTCGPAYRATGIAEAFIPRSEHEGKYIRAKAPLEAGGYAYTMLKDKVKLARPATNPIGLNIQGPNPPRVGTQLGGAARGISEYAPFLWQRCDTNGANPSGCEYVGSNRTYTPGAGDLNHYLRVHVYHGSWTRSTSGFTQQVADVQRPTQWFTQW